MSEPTRQIFVARTGAMTVSGCWSCLVPEVFATRPEMYVDEVEKAQRDHIRKCEWGLWLLPPDDPDYHPPVYEWRF